MSYEQYFDINYCRNGIEFIKVLTYFNFNSL